MTDKNYNESVHMNGSKKKYNESVHTKINDSQKITMKVSTQMRQKYNECVHTYDSQKITMKMCTQMSQKLQMTCAHECTMNMCTHESK